MSSSLNVVFINDDDKQEAEALKNKANALFKDHHYHEAIDLYTKAIEKDPSSAVYLSNRAFAHIRCEEYGSAISDASEAIKLNPKYVKGYYRRADANLALAKFKAALKDFQKAAKFAPRDPDLKRKLTECEKEVKRLRFEDALRTPDEEVVLVSDTLVLEDIVVDSSYEGPVMEKGEDDCYIVTKEFVLAMISAFKDQKKIHRRFALQILLDFQRLVKEQPSLVDVPVPEDGHITVCGDTHGQYYDLLNIFEMNGMPSASNPYLFNGDFVDRGSFSVEVILTLMAWKVCEPSCMHLSRGNHEAKSLNKVYGFEGEVKSKFNMTVMEVFSTDDVTLDDIRGINRFREPPDSGIMCEVLWSDPQPEMGRSPSKRGCGIQFGPDVTKTFLQKNGLELLVRSHEVKDNGYEVAHDGYCVTVFSAPNYCDNMDNKGAYIRFEGKDMIPHFTQFSAVPHPDVKPMAYANHSLFNFF